MIAFALAATLGFAWNPDPIARVYVIYLNNQVAYVGSNTTCEVSVEPRVAYRAELTAISWLGDEGERTGPLLVSVRPVTLYFERSQSVAGSWGVTQTNVAYMAETGSVSFYRARMAVAP